MNISEENKKKAEETYNEVIDTFYRENCIEIIAKALQEKDDKYESGNLNTLKWVKTIFNLHSDHSTICNGYRSLCEIIENIEKENNKGINA